MAIIKIPAENTTLTDARDVAAFLESRGIEYERWMPNRELAPDASAEDVLAAYADQVERDHAALAKAVKVGVLPAETGV